MRASNSSACDNVNWHEMAIQDEKECKRRDIVIQSKIGGQRLYLASIYWQCWDICPGCLATKRLIISLAAQNKWTID